jgi:Outer membrane protein beta-barrel domain
MIDTRTLIRHAGITALALVLTSAPSDANAIERKGFIAGLGVGGGKITCDGCESLSGPAVEVHIGGMINEKVALMFDGSGVAKEEDGVTLSSVVGGLALQYWASPRVWVKGGVGGGQIRVAGNGLDADSEMGLGFLGGLGVELLQKERFAIDLQLRFTTAKIEGERTTNVFAVVGFNFY